MISVASTHHVNKPRIIIAKFAWRVKRTDLMRKKLNLRNQDGPNVFTTDDLTKMRGKMFYELKQDIEIGRAFFLDSNIN